jgi:hypothetical protein
MQLENMGVLAGERRRKCRYVAGSEPEMLGFIMYCQYGVAETEIKPKALTVGCAGNAVRGAVPSRAAERR